MIKKKNDTCEPFCYGGDSLPATPNYCHACAASLIITHRVVKFDLKLQNLVAEMEETVPFKNLQSREYHGHEKKVIILSRRHFLLQSRHPLNPNFFPLRFITLEFVCFTVKRCIRWLGTAPARSSHRVPWIKQLGFGTLSLTDM